jgi:Arc/MetJ-type ribon-helix-helix transcriptional regulator
MILRRMASPPPVAPALLPTCVTLPRDQIDWLDQHAAARRISRSALVRQAVDALIRSRSSSARHADHQAD